MQIKQAVFFLRLAMGWLFFYAGITKVINSEWTASGYLNNASSLESLFAWFASPTNIGWVNFINEWGLTLIGLALILGFFTRQAAIGGIILMALYYLAILDFPKVGDHSMLIDEHIVYILVFWLLISMDAGKYKGLDGRKVR